MATSPRAEIIARNYLLRLRAMRAEMLRRLAAAYAAKLREDEIRASFAEFVPVAARAITAGQGAAQTLTRAYIRGVSGELALSPALAGKSEKGQPIAEVIGGMTVFILMAIRDGQTPTEALAVGGDHVNRMADNEMTRVVDSEINRQVSGRRSVGWTGIVNGPCDMCAGNAGDHSWDEEMVRHPWCQCDRLVRYEDFTYTAPELAFA